MSKNPVSASVHANSLRSAIAAEVSKGRCAGPFKSVPFNKFVCNPIGAVPKKNGEVRIILDLSQPSNDSVNSYINKDDFSLSYPTVDDAVCILNRLGKGAFMAKLDIKSAFRLIPVRVHDHHLLGFKFDNFYFYDTVLSMGCRSSPFWFCQCSEAVRWIVVEAAQHKELLVYFDDFWAASSSREQCQHVINAMMKVASELGVPLAEDKTEGPVTLLTFLGIEIDTIRQTLSLPKDKAAEIYDLVCQWLNKSKCSKQELQSLIGSLMFASKCVPASRLFIQRLLFLLRGISRRHATIPLDREFHLDLHWWKEFLPKWNGTASFLENDWTSSSVLHLYTDASGTLGMGAFFQGSWFQSRWPSWIRDQQPCIEYLELLPILFAILVWGHKFANKRILMHCDNLGAVQAWKKLGSHNRGVLSVMRRMVAVAARCNMQIKLEHIPGVVNDIADALSRFQVSRFRQLAPSADHLPTPFPIIWSELEAEHQPPPR